MILLNGYVEIKVEIDYDTSPAEPQTHNYPGCDATLELTSVLHNGIEIIDTLAPSALSELKEQCISHEEAINDRGNEP